MLAGFALMPVVLTIRAGTASIQSSDFTVLYTGATFVRHGQPAAVYDPARMAPALLKISGGRIDPSLAFDYPLADALPLLPFTLLPLQAAFRVWQLVILVFLGTSIWLLNRLYPLVKQPLGWGLLGMLAAEPTWALLTEGQLGGLLLLGAVAMLTAAALGRAGWGFAGGALLALKPQYLPAYLLLLWAVRRRRALLAGLAGGAMVVFSAMLTGWPSGMVAMLRTMITAGASTDLRSMDSWPGLLATVLPAWPATIAGLALLAGALVGLAGLAVRRWRDPLAFAGLAGCLALLGSPHTLPHDMVLLLVPAWTALEVHRQGRLRSPIPGLVVMQAAWVADLHGLPVSAGALALTGLLGWYVVDFRRRAAVTPPLAEAA